VNTLLLVAVKDPRITEIARIFNTFRFSIRTIAKEAGLSHTAINHWLRSADPRPRDGDKVDLVLTILQREERKLSTLPNNSRQSDTKTPYNTSSANLDSAQLKQLQSLTEKVQIEVQVVPVDKPWSAKSVPTTMINTSAFPGAAGRPIRLDGNLGENILPGQVIIFRAKEDDYISEDLYMIFVNKLDEDESVIGWFDPQRDSRTIQTMGAPMPLSDWKPTHEAFAVMWGKFGELTEYRISAKGIGPSTRL
jgi:AcrR family transcriptional regulator